MIATSTSMELRGAWEQDGYVVLRGFFDVERILAAGQDANRVHEEHQSLVSTKNLRCRWQDNILTGECQFDAFDPIIDLSNEAESLARDPNLIDAISELYSEQACLFKDKLIFKFPGVKGYNLHQDWIAWERFPRSYLSVIVPLDESHADNGCTIVYPGYHHSGSMSPEDGCYHELSLDQVDESTAMPMELKLGDVAVFSGFTPHRSNPNLSGVPRRQLYLSYTRHSDGGELRDIHYREYIDWLQLKYAEYGKTETYFA